MNDSRYTLILVIFFIVNVMMLHQVTVAQHGAHVLTFKPADAAANDQHIVLISGESKYHSEETLPMLAKILSHHHGFRTTVLFPIDPQTGDIKTDYKKNIPGLEYLRDADLMILSTRYQEWPDDRMKFFEEYLHQGKPIIGIRTATHAFRYQLAPDSPYAK